MIQELYLFYDGLNYYPMTSGQTKVVFSGRTYIPVVMERSSIKKSENISKGMLTIKLDINNSFAYNMLQNLVDGSVTLTVYRNNLVYWEGRVMSVKTEGLFVELSCTNTITMMRRTGLKNVYSINCRYQVYSEECGLAMSSNETIFANVTVNSTTITVFGLTAPNNFYTGGIAKFKGYSRGILSQIGNVLKLDGIFIDSGVGSLALYPGCPHTSLACETKFTIDNSINFGGEEYIPLRNPFAGQGAL